MAPPRTVKLAVVGGALLLAGGAAWTGWEASAAPPGRRLSSTPNVTATSGGVCAAGGDSFPIKGVQYVPHIVGEPYPHPGGSPDNVYAKQFRLLYERDMPLIRQLGADTLRLRPWDGSEGDREHLFQTMAQHGICKLIPTFQMAKHYVTMINQGEEMPDTGSSSALHKEFTRFAARMFPQKLDGLNVVAWTVDMSLDLSDLIPLVSTCIVVPPPSTEAGRNFNRYVALLTALVNWVQSQAGSIAPSLEKAPLLIPLDVSRLPMTSDYLKSIATFLECMPKWAPRLFEGTGGAETRWLLSFALPQNDGEGYPFKELLAAMGRRLHMEKKRAIVMVGTQALARDPTNPNSLIDDLGETAPPAQQQLLQDTLTDFDAASSTAYDGFLLDEWSDDWDRGVRGPFFLARSSVEDMQEECQRGGRYSHDITRCARRVGDGWIYPEYFGMSRISSEFGMHCAQPRFFQGLFSFGGVSTSMEKYEMSCRRAVPAWLWETVAVGTVILVIIYQLVDSCMKVCREGDVSDDEPEAEVAKDDDPKYVGYVRVEPQEARLKGNFLVELYSKRMRSHAEVGWWLHSHLSTQLASLEKQVMAEAEAQRAMRNRKRDMGEDSDDSDMVSSSDSETDSVLGADDTDLFARAMETIHARVLEGFGQWCRYVASGSAPKTVEKNALKEFAEAVTKNQGRALPRLFAEALLLRTMESLGEQIICCPERLSFLYYGIVSDAGGMCMPEDEQPGTVKYMVDLEELQEGLPQMSHHSNPYFTKKMPDGTSSRGLNFDDINESGIQCREKVAKTYREPASIQVIFDAFLCYRVPLVLKLWSMLLAFYIYLGTGYGNDISTLNNGEWYWPEWLRLNFIQWSALADGTFWLFTEVLYLLYFTWQRAPSIGYRSPGLPTLMGTLEHIVNIIFTAVGFLLVYNNSNFASKPMLCAQSDVGVCEDERASASKIGETLGPALGYWAVRILLFFITNRRRFPIFILGTSSNSRFVQGRIQNDIFVSGMWILMLGSCILMEVFFIFPSVRGLDMNSLCGMTRLGNIYGLPKQYGVCSAHAASFSCVSCVSSVVFAQCLTLLTCMVDVYFVFYIYSAIVGSAMGQNRFLNDLKNTGVPIDLRPGVGREARLFEETFGPDWQRVWCAMLNNLLEESYISPKQAEGLAAAARCSLDALSCVIAKDAKREKPINLKKFNSIAGERLAFFFHSLKWIKSPSGPARGLRFHSDTDALTGKNFNLGSVPTLTMIIPAYNEAVIPSAAFLRDGALREDAMNQNPDGQIGVGDPTLPPVGDGVNSNLAFIISQFPDEWIYLAERLFSSRMMEDPGSHRLYKKFMSGHLSMEVEEEVRIWAMLRTQSVGRTVVGALQYGQALSALPAVQRYYAQRPGKRIPEDHMEVILAHQTYGQSAPEGDPDNDTAVRLLLSRYGTASLFLVFDMTPSSGAHVRNLVEGFLQRNGGYGIGAFKYASVKCRWSVSSQDIEVIAVLPRKFPLRLGQGDFKTQGKACNQLNGLRFATGHFVQALDCNMGVFVGEGFKVPYVLRVFMPLDKKNRVTPRCRYLGFREFIFTGREGTVGKCHASAEWTFGTIYQRFLSGMGTRMHYGHPDFVDGFWARNRGGMSKSSPVVNLSEDIFAGYNVRMREEASPHIDALEFEKGRESTFNSASNFFSKISGGSIAVIRSRDNHLLCERIGLTHSLSFYFTSVAFYTSNLFIDMTIYLYVMLFISFTLADIDLAKLHELGSTFSTEWIMSMGIFSLVPQLLEMVLEFGATKALREVLGMLPAATFFFIFQNKNIASSLRNGVATGIAKYFFTGRPMANQHQTWRDIYVTYCKSHYNPAFTLMTLYIIYQVLVKQTFQGALPMVLVVISFISWFVTPVIFSPFPRWPLIEQDIREFSAFINGKAGKEEDELAEVVKRGQTGKVRTLWECGLSFEINSWAEASLWLCITALIVKGLCVIYMLFLVPSEILDFLWIYILVWAINTVCVLAYLVLGQNNLLLNLQGVGWLLAIPIGSIVLGSRAVSPTVVTRLPELIVSFVVFMYVLGFFKDFVLLLNKLLHVFRTASGGSHSISLRHHNQMIRKCFLYFQVHQMDMVQAYIILIANTVASVLLMLVDRVFCNIHTWWLLNREMGRMDFDGQYLAKSPPKIESDQMRDGTSIGGSSELGYEDSMDFGGTPTTRTGGSAATPTRGMQGQARPLLSR